MRTKLIVWCCLMVGMLVITGCSSGGSGGGTTDTVSGVAAAGAVISGTVYLKDSAATPKELSKDIAADGSFSFNVTGMTKPYLLKAVGTANGTSYTLYSMAADKGIANINPMTHLIVANAAGTGDPAIIYNAPQTATMQAMANKLSQAVVDVQTSLNALLQAHNSASVNPISDTYKVDHTGLDGLLDLVKVEIDNGMVIVTNSSTNAVIFTGQVATILNGTLNTKNIPQPSLVKPTITSANSATFSIGTASSFPITTAGYPKPALSISGILPSGVLFDATTGALSGTPANGTIGTYNLTFAANNGISPDASQSFTLTVSAIATSPFILTGKMKVVRQGHSATVLPNGKVLIVGGDTNFTNIYAGTATSTSEIYDPATGTFTLSGNTVSNHSYHTATLLPNGKVLIAGGESMYNYHSQGSQNDSTDKSEIFDPVTGTFSATGNMVYSLFAGHSSTLLNNGKVIIIGTRKQCVGYWCEYYEGVGQIYDPATGVFTYTGSTTNRSYHTATLLSNGNVLITGGYGNTDYGLSGCYNSTEIYDTSTATFTAAANMLVDRANHTATALPDGTVLITGGHNYFFGYDWVDVATSEYYNPTTGVFTSSGSMNTLRSGHSATLLVNGKVLIVGGSTAEIYDPVTRSFTLAGTMLASFSNHTATLLNTGKVLIVGAGDVILNTTSNPVELYFGL